MTPHSWLSKLHDERTSLLSQHDLSACDAYRLLILEARLGPSLSPFQHTALLSQCEPPDPADLLDDLEAQLEDDDPPQGLLLRFLLSIDGRASFDHLFSSPQDPILLPHACCLLSLFPSRLVDLVDFASLRLSTLPEDHPVVPLWQTVLESPVEVLRNSL